MGIDVHGARFLFYARKMGTDLAQTATIGRQGLFLMPPELRALARSFGSTVNESHADLIFGRFGGYAEGLLQYLGAADVQSFDFSPYEGATNLHDMNQPIPTRFHEQYSAVIDSGSLEHVFNFPQAIKNCMEMVKLGGHYLGITPANNFFGHGFYQFSPELHFNIFSEQNGFEVVNMVAYEQKRNPKWYAVRGPLEVGGRVTLCNATPVFLLVLAKRIARKQIFETMPQQSDYVAIWRERARAAIEGQVARVAPAPRPLPIRIAKTVVPGRVRRGFRHAQAYIERLLSRSRAPMAGFDPRFFRPFDPAADRRRA